MTADIRALLAAGRFQVPGDEQRAQLQAYWDQIAALAAQVSISQGDAEPAITYAAWRAEDD